MIIEQALNRHQNQNVSLRDRKDGKTKKTEIKINSSRAKAVKGKECRKGS